jgi:ankyrin repeat protein
LLDGGENVNVRGSQNRTALQRAAGANMIEVCKLLIKRGADASLQDDMGRSALYVVGFLLCFV